MCNQQQYRTEPDFFVRLYFLVLNGTTKNAYELAQLAYLLFADAFIDGIAFHEEVL